MGINMDTHITKPSSSTDDVLVCFKPDREAELSLRTG